MTFNLEEYEICRKRGHEPGPSAFTNMQGTTYTCVYCGIGYRVETTTVVIEHHRNEDTQVVEIRTKQPRGRRVAW